MHYITSVGIEPTLLDYESNVLNHYTYLYLYNYGNSGIRTHAY